VEKWAGTSTIVRASNKKAGGVAYTFWMRKGGGVISSTAGVTVTSGVTGGLRTIGGVGKIFWIGAAAVLSVNKEMPAQALHLA